MFGWPLRRGLWSRPQGIARLHEQRFSLGTNSLLSAAAQKVSTSMKIEGSAKLVRIFLGESDRWKGQPLYIAIVEEMRKAGLAGATAFKGVLGFGAHSVMHAARIVDLSSDLPIMIELVDSEENVDAFLPTLDVMVSEGLVTIENIRVIAYKAGVPK